MTSYPCTFFANIDGLILPENFDDLEIKTGYYLSSSGKKLKNIISNDISTIIGNYNTFNFFDNKCFIRYDNLLAEPETKGGSYLRDFFSVNIFFCQTLWLCKDNSVIPELGYLKFFSESLLKVQAFNTNTIYSNYKGSFEDCQFTLDELNKAVEYFPVLMKLSSAKELNPYTNLSSNGNRIARAMLFIQSARLSPDLGSKVAYYCSSFESLFSISSAELKHRLSETIAFFLESENLLPREVYENLKLAYDLRSSVVHGSIISKRFTRNDFELLIKTVGNCDNYARLIIKKIMSDPNLIEIYRNGKSEDLNTQLIELIFKK